MKRKTVGIAFIMLGLTAYAAVGAPSETELMRRAKVSKAQAEKIARQKVPNGRFAGEEIEKENGKIIWSFDITSAGTRNITELQVDAITGKIVSMKTETPKDQARQTAVDKKSK